MVDRDHESRFLDHFWDKLVDSDSADPERLDVETAAFVRNMQALAAVPDLTAAHDRVKRRLNFSSSDPMHQKESPMQARLELIQPRPVYPNGRSRATSRRVLDSDRMISGAHQWAAVCFSAVLVLLTVGVAFSAIRLSDRGSGGGNRNPAAVAPASPSPSDAASPSPADPTLIEGLFDVGGHELYISCTGSGSPTVVFLNRLDKTTDYWDDIPGAISNDTRVCVYDRANLGKSGRMPMRTGADSVADLHALLQAAKVPGPYLLVGDEFGGLIATMYAGSFPDEVAGLVLIGPVHPWDQEIENLIPEPDKFGIRDEHAGNRELVAFYASLDQQLELLPKVGAIPVVVLVGDNIAIPESWPVDRIRSKVYELYQKFADSFSQGTMIRLNSTSYIVQQAPDQVIGEVQKVLMAVQAT